MPENATLAQDATNEENEPLNSVAIQVFMEIWHQNKNDVRWQST